VLLPNSSWTGGHWCSRAVKWGRGHKGTVGVLGDLEVLGEYETWPKILSSHLVVFKIFLGYIVMEDFEVSLESLFDAFVN
jgi:hypothetical protein